MLHCSYSQFLSSKYLIYEGELSVAMCDMCQLCWAIAIQSSTFSMNYAIFLNLTFGFDFLIFSLFRPSPQLQNTQAVHLWLSVAEVGVPIEELPLVAISGVHQDNNLGEDPSGVPLQVLEGNGEWAPVITETIPGWDSCELDFKWNIMTWFQHLKFIIRNINFLLQIVWLTFMSQIVIFGKESLLTSESKQLVRSLSIAVS